jgi:hypothetical protein
MIICFSSSEGNSVSDRCDNIGTYWSSPRADGSLFGEGQGVFMTADGEMVSWKDLGSGRLTGGGGAGFRGALVFNTTSQKLSKLNVIAGAFEFEADGEGHTNIKMWE